MSDISIISAILVVIIAFFAGLEGILDQFQMHQPLVACTLIGLVTGHLEAGVILGGTLQMLALGWANIGAAVAPDAALASVAAAIIMVKSGDFTQKELPLLTQQLSHLLLLVFPYNDRSYFVNCPCTRW